MARWEVHLALWDALVIEGDTAWTCTESEATDAKRERKKGRKEEREVEKIKQQ